MPWWVGLIAAAAGTFAQQRAQKQAQKKAEFYNTIGTQFGLEKSQQSQRAIEDFLQTLDPAQQQQQQGDIRDELRQNLEAGVGATQGFDRPADFAGKVSERFATTRGAGREKTAERIRRMIEQGQIIGTPTQASLQNAFRLGTAGSTVDAANQARNNVDFRVRQAISGVRPSGALNVLGGLGTALGTAYAGRK